MEPQRFVERILDDEALTDGIADEEAKLLLRWAVDQVERQVAPLEDPQEASERTQAVRKRCRALADVVESLCYDEDEETAHRRWSELGNHQELAPLRRRSPVVVVEQLLKWESVREG